MPDGSQGAALANAAHLPLADAGADTLAVLTEAGLTEQELAEMRAEGAI